MTRISLVSVLVLLACGARSEPRAREVEASRPKDVEHSAPADAPDAGQAESPGPYDMGPREPERPTSLRTTYLVLEIHPLANGTEVLIGAGTDNGIRMDSQLSLLDQEGRTIRSSALKIVSITAKTTAATTTLHFSEVREARARAHIDRF